tara:strand:+ start:157 stop:366 length:210 start_codon:yes stop_codon:yes gene_type:complete
MQIFLPGQIMFICAKTAWENKQNGGITAVGVKAGFWQNVTPQIIQIIKVSGIMNWKIIIQKNRGVPDEK